MNRTRFRLSRLTILWLLCVSLSVSAEAQRAGRFAGGGLAFDYPADWPLRDESDEDCLHLVLHRGSGEARIVVFAPRATLTPPQLEEMEQVITPMIIWSTREQLRQFGGDVQPSYVSAEIGGVRAEGVRLSAVLDGEPGGADIYWAALDGRLVYVLFSGSDAARARAAGAWSLITGSLRVYDSLGQKTPEPLTPTKAAAPGGERGQKLCGAKEETILPPSPGGSASSAAFCSSPRLRPTG